MKLESERIDRVVLALLHLGLHDDFRAWKSVAFTESGLRESQRLLAELFAATAEEG